MMTRMFWLGLACGAVACGLLLSVTAHRPVALAAVSASSNFLSGRLYPATLRAEQFDATYQVLDLVDTQGKPGTYVTRGDTAAVGGETFLVAYFLPTTGGGTVPRQPQRGTTGQLFYINMHYVQAILNAHAVVPGGTLPDGGAMQNP